MTTAIDSPGPATTPDAASVLKPYVPRLVIDWLRTGPDALHREVEASLVFVDISGFTALTERLARKGKVGAELMRDTLDGVFTALLDEAYDWGAGLLKWGGDALLLMFDGPGHPQRAARAAWEMQATIDRVGRLQVSGGTIVLRMSVGIGTGRYQFFMTGSVHRELLIAGPAMTETLAMEAIADAGEIGLSPGLVALLPRACIGPQKDGITLLAGPPEVERGRAPDVGDIRGLDIASCIPVAARAHVLLARSEPEHRTITAAFIDLMDTDRLLEELGPDALGRALDQRMRAIQEAALRFEVPFYETDVGKSSVKALLTAGAPSSTGHDEERMLRTLREIMDQDGTVPMRIGVNTGKVFTGDFGPPYRRAYRVFGDAINTAARVMSKADAGQILSTEIVLNRSRTIFEAAPITPFAAKGKSEPVRASIVGPAIGLKESHHGGIALLGRDAELAMILDAVEAARRGRGSVVAVSGPAGIGKTRLIEEVVARSPDVRVITSTGEEYEASTPYFPFRAIMRDVIGVPADADTPRVVDRLRAAVAETDPTLGPWVPLLGILIGVDLPATPETAALDDRFLRDRLSEVALGFLASALHGSPTMFVVEDAQHLDEASRDLLLRLSAAATDRRQIIVVTHPDGSTVIPSERDDAVRLIDVPLRPLPDETLARILESATDDDPLRPHEIEELTRRSGGNPLFLFQLLDTVRESGTFEALPDSIEALIAGEIDRLEPTDRTILRYAAVFGTTIPPALLIDCIGSEITLDDGVWSRLGDLLQRAPDGDLRFKSALIRDAAYEGLPYRRRRALHGRVGEAIEAMAGSSLDEEIGVLAFHYSEAQRWDKAWRFCRQAGDRAMAIYANLEAARLFGQALVAGGHLRSVSRAELAGLHERSSDALYRLGDFPAADRALVAARRAVRRDPMKVAPLYVKQAMVATRIGEYGRALRQIGAGLRGLDGVRRPGVVAQRARLMVQIGASRYLQNRRVESIEWCRRAAREAKRGRAPDALAMAYKVLDLALLENGQVEKARYSPLALAIYEELGDLRNQAITLSNLGLIAHGRSEWVPSLDLYQRALAMFEQIGDRTTAALAKFNISEILSDQGRYDDADAMLKDVLRVWRASGAELDLAAARMEYGKLAARRGDVGRAREMLDAARSVQDEAGNVGEVLITDTWIAEMLVLSGDTAAARTLIADALARTSTVEGGSVAVPRLRRLDAWAIAADGDHAAAWTASQAALQTARQRHDLYESALALSGLVALGRTLDRPTTALERERADLFARLGIIEAPTIDVEASSAVGAAG